MDFTEIMPLEDWVEFENEIHKRSGFDATVYDINGVGITDNKNWANKLCPVIKSVDRGITFICAVANKNMAAQAANEGKPVMEECDAGMIKIAVPIFADDEFIGAVGACGLLTEEGEVDSFLINRITGIDEDKIEKLAGSVKKISEKKALDIVDYIWENVKSFVKDYEDRKYLLAVNE
jgi:ligand-binding sensor protein